MELPSTVDRQRLDLVDVVERLAGEYEDILPAGTVMRCVADCRRELGAAPAPPSAAEVERLARCRLVDRVGPPDGTAAVSRPSS